MGHAPVNTQDRGLLVCVTKPPFFGDWAGISITAAVKTALGSLPLCGALTLVIDSGVGGTED